MLGSTFIIERLVSQITVKIVVGYKTTEPKQDSQHRLRSLMPITQALCRTCRDQTRSMCELPWGHCHVSNQYRWDNL